MILDGFLLSFNEKYVEFFNVRAQRVVKMADTATDRSVLQRGYWYRFLHNIRVKYSPDGNTNFEVVKFYGKGSVPINNEVQRNRNPHLYGVICFHGLCIEMDKRNPAYNRNSRGSEERCNNLFSLNGGVYRSAGSARVQLGQWYQHMLYDSAKKNKDMKSSYHTITATNFIKVRPPVPTQVIDGRVTVRVQFKYDEVNFESEENSKLSHWSDRYQGMNEISEFWNEFVGKVEIYGKEALEIVQRVERYRAGLSAENLLDHITIAVTVVPRTDVSWQHHKYPMDGAFRVKSVDKLKNAKGELIAENRKRY
ncbi:hypothetical protein CRE_20850 [Caenorhabditis remanei]|uniref:DUF7040 domain-containing protein n=1 Tax=Caenorhabditis remanei TaxID=31234 RepID=E3MV50_CAERE|nr:hypothetical protein CRE_20850 [Caenorhabditis remanei]